MSSIHFFKLCKILADHDQCIQWCKENNLLASSIKCPRENCNILTCRLGQTIFDVVFFVSKSLLGIERQKKLEKFAILTRKPRSHARILIYRTWPHRMRWRYEWRCSRRKWHRCAHTAHWKYMVGSQTKYASYRNIQRALRKLPTGMVWRQHYGDDPFGNIIKHIADLYEVRKDA